MKRRQIFNFIQIGKNISNSASFSSLETGYLQLMHPIFAHVSPCGEPHLPDTRARAHGYLLSRQKLEDLGFFSQVKGKLSEHVINGVFDYGGKSRSTAIVMQT